MSDCNKITKLDVFLFAQCKRPVTTYTSRFYLIERPDPTLVGWGPVEYLRSSEYLTEEAMKSYMRATYPPDHRLVQVLNTEIHFEVE